MAVVTPLLLMLVYAAGLMWLVWQGLAPWWILLLSPLLNLAAFYIYWRDKFAAQQRRWRTRESTLQLLSLAGGWGGAWFAQWILRHKSVKPSFRVAYWTTVLSHCAAVLGYWWWRSV